MERQRIRQTRTSNAGFEARDEGGALRLEGYFAVFDSNYEVFPLASESIAPGAFDGQLSGDVRCLIDHDTRLVLGRTAANTLTLKVDEKGLWGSVLINPQDTDAMNLYARVQRGDVSQCSFGFDILDEEEEFKSDGSVHWTIKAVRLYEVSVVTFPAYEETGISARKAEYEAARRRRNDAWRARMTARLRRAIKRQEA